MTGDAAGDLGRGHGSSDPEKGLDSGLSLEGQPKDSLKEWVWPRGERTEFVLKASMGTVGGRGLSLWHLGKQSSDKQEGPRDTRTPEPWLAGAGPR